MRIKLLRRHNRNIVSISIFLTGLMLGFNNCSQLGFSTNLNRSVASVAGSSDSASTVTPVDPSGSGVDPVIPAPVTPPVVTNPVIVLPAADLKFTTPGALITPTLALAGNTISVQATLKTVTAASGLSVDLEIRDSVTQKPVAKKVFANQSFTANAVTSFSWIYVLPADIPVGNYYLTVAVFDAAFKITYVWNNNAAPFAVLAAALPKPVSALDMVGVNLSGAEFNSGNANARMYFEYVYPTNNEIDNLVAKKMKTVRLPFSISRLQPKLNTPLDATELAALDKVVQYANTKGVTIILDPHNYGFMKTDAGVSAAIGIDPAMPASNFADFWTRLSKYYVNQPNVMFNLMNEPYKQTAVQWKDAAVPAIKAIRATGALQKILIPGTSYTGAHSWVSSGNAAAWTGFTDSNFGYDVHQYLDSNNSGTHSECVVGKGSKALMAFTNWARTNKVEGFLGEAGWSTNPACLIEGEALLNYMSANTDVWLGLSYFAAGPWMGSYDYTVEPIGLGTSIVIERPQMLNLLRYVK